MGKIQSSYYNSNLNKYIGENLPKTFTLIDVDGLQYKRLTNHIRVYEYKQPKERIGRQQLIALKKLAEVFKAVDDLIYFNVGMITLEVVIIRGGEPYDKLEISDLVNGRKFTVINKSIINDFLSMNLTVSDLYNKHMAYETNEAI